MPAVLRWRFGKHNCSFCLVQDCRRWDEFCQWWLWAQVWADWSFVKCTI